MEYNGKIRCIKVTPGNQISYLKPVNIYIFVCTRIDSGRYFVLNIRTMQKLIIATPLLIHGLAHISGFLAAYYRVDVGFKTRPWIFSGSVFLGKGLGRIFGILWLLALACFLAAGLMVLFAREGWMGYAMAGAILSILAIFPWWHAVPAGAKIGLVFDLIILITVLSPLKEAVFTMLR
jgi:hypothetical protein